MLTQIQIAIKKKKIHFKILSLDSMIWDAFEYRNYHLPEILAFCPQFLKKISNMPLFKNYIGICPYFDTRLP